MIEWWTDERKGMDFTPEVSRLLEDSYEIDWILILVR